MRVHLYFQMTALVLLTGGPKMNRQLKACLTNGNLLVFGLWQQPMLIKTTPWGWCILCEHVKERGLTIG